MRGALGNSLLLSIIITFVGAIVIFFVSILSYSKAFRAKNRIIEVIEKYGVYDSYDQNIKDEIGVSLAEMGYQLGECDHESLSSGNGYKYCVDEITATNGKYYKVSTYVQFNFPIIGEIIKPKVTSETKILNVDYNFD